MITKGCCSYGEIVARTWVLILAVELAVRMSETASGSTLFIAGLFLVVSMAFVVRSFYGMRIHSKGEPASKA